MTETCERCGGVIQVGDWPLCGGDPSQHTPTRQAIVTDDVPGGFWQTNGFREPRKFYSKSARDQALAANGFEIRVRHVPVPGTDKSPYTTDHSKGCMDAGTLESARILVSRGATRTREPRPQDDPDYGPPIPITVTDGAPFTTTFSSVFITGPRSPYEWFDMEREGE